MSRKFAVITMDVFRTKVVEAILSTKDSRYEAHDHEGLAGFLDCYAKGMKEFLETGNAVSTDFLESDSELNDAVEGWLLIKSAKIEKDLEKVIFDWENYGLEDWKVASSGMPYILAIAGGDWEHPVRFILYWDGKGLRGYIPENGNTFNTASRTAYGSEEENENYTGPEYDGDTQYDPDFALMDADIVGRITKSP